MAVASVEGEVVQRSSLTGYAVALTAVAVAVLARLLLQPWVGDNVPFITMFAAVGVAAWYGGRNAGLLALVVSAVATDYFFIPPRFALGVRDTELRVALGLYGLVCLPIIAVVHSLRTAQRRHAEKQQELERQVAATRAAEQQLSARQTALERSEERFRTIFETAGVSLWEEDFSEVKAALKALGSEGVTDFARYFQEHPDFVRRAMGMIRVIDVNDATVRLFEAADKTELLGSLPTIFPPESTPVFVGELLTIAEGRHYFEAEALLNTVRGKPVYVLFTMVLPTGDGPYDRVLFSVVDLTERKQAEERLRENEEQLREADRRKDEFLATLAHELRNPLAPVRNVLAMLDLAADPTAVLHDARAIMTRQVDHMVHLIDDLLDVSRISQGKLEIRPQQVELASIVRDALETSRLGVDTARHELVVNLPAQAVHLLADPIRLTQVLTNLLSNAANFTPAGGRITLTATCDGPDLVISVEDDGIGIPAGRLDNIFDMFVQGDHSLERSHGGLGIGLALSRQLVQLHGGSIRALSDGPGLGSEFVVRVPVVIEKPAEGAAGDVVEAPVPEGRRIVVVDDNRDSAESLATLLRLLGNDTRTAHDGEEAIGAAEEFRPDLIFLDIGMPRLNGYDACRAIRQRPWGSSVSIIALTGWGQPEDVQKAREAGFDAHLVKPVDLAELKELLGSVRSNDGREHQLPSHWPRERSRVRRDFSRPQPLD